MSELKSIDAVIIELHDNPLTGRKDDRYGRIVNIASINTETLIRRATAAGFNGNEASMKATLVAVDEEVIKAVVRFALFMLRMLFASRYSCYACCSLRVVRLRSCLCFARNSLNYN